jgi:hypothetical protein
MRARCTGALSSWKTYSLSAKYRAITGHKLFSRTFIYIWELIFPFTSVKVQPIAGNINNQNEFIAEIQRVWESLPVNYIQGLTKPFQHRYVKSLGWRVTWQNIKVVSHTRWISAINSFWLLMFPAIGCSALFMRSQTFSHTFKSGDCADHVVQFIL